MSMLSDGQRLEQFINLAILITDDRTDPEINATMIAQTSNTLNNGLKGLVIKFDSMIFRHLFLYKFILIKSVGILLIMLTQC
jgi:hypothetical protein